MPAFNQKMGAPLPNHSAVVLKTIDSQIQNILTHNPDRYCHQEDPHGLNKIKVCKFE